MTVSPVCFLIINAQGASILPINAQAVTSVDRLIEMLPGAVSKVSSFVENRKSAKPGPVQAAGPSPEGTETPEA